MTKFIGFTGRKVSLIGRTLKAGEKAPDFKAVSADFKDVGLNDFTDQIKVILSFLTLEGISTTRIINKFKKNMLNAENNIVLLIISKDLPFSQARYRKASYENRVKFLSDYKYSLFGINYGLLIKEMDLLASSVIIIDKNNIVRYIKSDFEAAEPPDYKNAIKYLKEVISHPSINSKEWLPLRCKPCEGGTPPMPQENIRDRLKQLTHWELIDGTKIRREVKFKDFEETKYFLDMISAVAQEQDHHPTLTWIYNKLKITLTTHAAGGLTENDFIMAQLIDDLFIKSLS